MPAESLHVIDAHHHLWRYSEEQYPWISERMGILRRDYSIEEMKLLAYQHGIIGTIAVQARQSLEETEWLLSLAEQNSLIRGVVGWVPLIDPAIERCLEQFGGRPLLKGVRHVLHDELDDYYMMRSDFNHGIALLQEFDLIYDILIFEKHLPQTISFVDRHPNQIFVVDHIAKPRITSGEPSAWQANIEELAKRPNVYCKLSGIVTEANWDTWSLSELQPYFDCVLDAFGPARLMFGSDWPVVTLSSSYGRWLDVIKRVIANLSLEEQRSILLQTATAVYNL